MKESEGALEKMTTFIFHKIPSAFKRRFFIFTSFLGHPAHRLDQMSIMPHRQHLSNSSQRHRRSLPQPPRQHDLQHQLQSVIFPLHSGPPQKYFKIIIALMNNYAIIFAVL
jgi:hypothetical protein